MKYIYGSAMQCNTMQVDALDLLNQTNVLTWLQMGFYIFPFSNFCATFASLASTHSCQSRKIQSTQTETSDFLFRFRFIPFHFISRTISPASLLHSSNFIHFLLLFFGLFIVGF